MIYYRRYSGDYLRDTARLSMLDHGAYSLMLEYYYSEESPLPLDLEEIYTMVRAMTPADRQSVDKVLARYFVEEPDGYHNSRADKEIGIANSVITAARENGKLGGRPRKNNLEQNPNNNLAINQEETQTKTKNVTQNLSQTEPTNNHPPTSNHHPSAVSLQPSGKSARGTRLPENWEPSVDLWKWTHENQPTWDQSHAYKVLANFRDFWTAKAGANAAKLDWDATWRTWVRKEVALKGQNGSTLGDRNRAAAVEWARGSTFDGTQNSFVEMAFEAERLEREKGGQP